MRRVTGDYQGAARDLKKALGICLDIGFRAGQAETLNESGTLYRVRGDLRGVRDRHQDALDLARETKCEWDQAHALAGLGRCALASDDRGEAADWLRQALEIFQRIGTVEAADVSAALQVLPAPDHCAFSRRHLYKAARADFSCSIASLRWPASSGSADLNWSRSESRTASTGP